MNDYIWGMITRLRNTIFFPLIWGLLGLHFLNTSVDFEDPSAAYIPEDLTFNDQESLIEFFLEKILGYEKAIAEHDDQDTNDQQKKKSNNVDYIWYCDFQEQEKPFSSLEKLKNYAGYRGVLQNGTVRIDSPPPKA